MKFGFVTNLMVIASETGRAIYIVNVKRCVSAGDISSTWKNAKRFKMDVGRNLCIFFGSIMFSAGTRQRFNCKELRNKNGSILTL